MMLLAAKSVKRYWCVSIHLLLVKCHWSIVSKICSKPAFQCDSLKVVGTVANAFSRVSESVNSVVCF